MFCYQIRFDQLQSNSTYLNLIWLAFQSEWKGNQNLSQNFTAMRHCYAVQDLVSNQMTEIIATAGPSEEREVATFISIRAQLRPSCRSLLQCIYAHSEHQCSLEPTSLSARVVQSSWGTSKQYKETTQTLLALALEYEDFPIVLSALNKSTDRIPIVLNNFQYWGPSTNLLKLSLVLKTHQYWTPS